MKTAGGVEWTCVKEPGQVGSTEGPEMNWWDRAVGAGVEGLMTALAPQGSGSPRLALARDSSWRVLVMSECGV